MGGRSRTPNAVALDGSGVEEPNHYVAVFDRATWQMFLDAGGRVAGFREPAASRARRMRVGDLLLCYVVDGVGFIGAARVVGASYTTDDTDIWDSIYFPVRVPVELVLALPEAEAVKIPEIIEDLPRIHDATRRAPGAWGNFVRAAPRLWPREEAEVVLAAMRLRQGAAS